MKIMKKFKISSINYTNPDDVTLYRICAVSSFVTASGDRVSKGEFGGWIEKESNLSQEGNCWVFDDAKVFGDAFVRGDAIVKGNAKVFGSAEIKDNAVISGNADIFGVARIYQNAQVCGLAKVFGSVLIKGNALITGRAKVRGDGVIIGGNAILSGDTETYGSKFQIYESVFFEDAIVKSIDDFFSLGPIDGLSITLFRTANNEIRIGEFATCSYYDFEKFMSLGKMSPLFKEIFQKVYSVFVEYVLQDIFAPCPICRGRVNNDPDASTIHCLHCGCSAPKESWRKIAVLSKKDFMV